jgi:hypothetical protein
VYVYCTFTVISIIGITWAEAKGWQYFFCLRIVFLVADLKRKNKKTWITVGRKGVYVY